MRLIYILILLIFGNGSYSEKDCQQVMIYFSQGMKTNEVLDMLSEDGISLLDKISSKLDNIYVLMGSEAGKLLYRTYLKKIVDECNQLYWRVQQKKAEEEEAKKMKIQAEDEERKAEKQQKAAHQETIWNTLGLIAIIGVGGFILIGGCLVIGNRINSQRKKID